MERLEKELEREHIPARRLHTSHAFHSSMMDPILEEFEDAVSRIRLSQPAMPFVSTLTGDWAGEDVTQPDYWSRQLRQTVRFADGMRTLMSSGDLAVKESDLYRSRSGKHACPRSRARSQTGKPSLCLQSLPGPDARRSDTEEMLNALGQLWANGVEVDWEVFPQHGTAVAGQLADVSFRAAELLGWHERFGRNSEEARDPFNWFYRAVWREEPFGASKTSALAGRRILVLDRETSPGAAIVEEPAATWLRCRHGAARRRVRALKRARVRTESRPGARLPRTRRPPFATVRRACLA